MKKLYFALLFSLNFLIAQDEQSNEQKKPSLPRHELFWEYNDVWHSLDSWSQTFYQESSKAAREYIKEKKYTSMLDVGCGACPDYYGFIKDQYHINYTGIDITPRFLEFGATHDLPMQYGHSEKIPFDENKFEVVYARHLFEHLRYYKKTLQEMIRVAQKEVMIVFFLKPHELPDALDYRPQEKSAVFNNRYNQQKIESFLKNHAKVESFSWQILEKSVPEGDESILHICLKTN